MKTRQTAVNELVDWHFKTENGLQKVLYFPSENERDPIRLIEVNDHTIATGSFDVYTFAPSKDIPFPVQIAELSPLELDTLQRDGKIPWKFEAATTYCRPAA
jgi:hypothetical protein